MKTIKVLLWVLVLGLPEGVLAADPLKQNPLSIEKLAELSAPLEPETADLVVRGKIGRLNPALFTLDTLKKFQPTSFRLKNHWTGAAEKYTGVAFIELLSFLGLDESAKFVDVIAINDYRIKIKIKDLKTYEYLLSYALNDKDYSAHEPENDKGPIAIAINFDKHPELDRDIYKHQLVWFVQTIIVE